MELEWRQAILLGVALRVGLLEAVAGAPRPAGEVAVSLGLDARATRAILSALAEIGVLDEEVDGFRLREEHRAPLLQPDHEDYVGQSVVHRLGLITAWSHLPEVLRTGDPVEDRTQPDFAGTADFIAAMRRQAQPNSGAIAAEMLPGLPERALVLDVGGGPGANEEAFAAGGARVTVLDRPEVISLMRDTLASSGIETRSGDMNDGLPEGPYDAIYFGNTSHMYDPEENHVLFRRMRESLVPGGLLVVREIVRDMSEEAAVFAVNMLVLTPNGSTYTAEQYEEWLAGAGFERPEFVGVRGTHLIFARNAR